MGVENACPSEKRVLENNLREQGGQSFETYLRTTARIENVEGAGGACLVLLRKNGRSGPLTTVTVVFSRTEGVIMTLLPSANTKGDRE